MAGISDILENAFLFWLPSILHVISLISSDVSWNHFLNKLLKSMSQGLLLGGPKLRQHCFTYLISSVNVNKLIVMRTVIIAAFFPPRIYIFIIVSILHPSSLIFSTKT